jgi:hypothetical protein
MVRLLRSMQSEYQALCESQRVTADIRVSSAAGSLANRETGVVVDIDSIAGVLADVREEYGVGPDVIQNALVAHEPSLRTES